MNLRTLLTLKLGFGFLLFSNGAFAATEVCARVAQVCTEDLASRVQLCRQYQSRLNSIEIMARNIERPKSERAREGARKGCAKGIVSFGSSLKIMKDAAKILSAEKSETHKSCGAALAAAASEFEKQAAASKSKCSG